MTSTQKRKPGSDEEAAKPTRRAPIWLLGLAWLLPGAGHWALGKRVRAVVFAAIIVSAFTTGVLVDGELGVPRPGSPFSWLATLACLGNGLLYLVRLLWLNGIDGVLGGGLPYGLTGGGSPIAAGFSYGNTFLYTAGLMNLLAVLDTSDIHRGEKP
jgi:hypothetical protein